MAKWYLKVLSCMMVATLLCMFIFVSITVDATNTENELEEYFTGGESSRMEMTDNNMGLAFCFSLPLRGAILNEKREMILNNANLDVAGETIFPTEVGVVVTNQEEIGEDDNSLTLDQLSTSTIKIPIKYLIELQEDRILFAVRIINILNKYKDVVLHARPYFQYVNSQGETITFYGNVARDNISGKQRKYDCGALEHEWTVGAVNETTGVNLKNTKAVRSAYFNNLNLLVRMSESLSVRAFFYDAKGFVFSEMVSDWTVLSELDVSGTCTHVRLQAMNNGTQTTIKDAAAFGAQIEIRYAKSGDILPVSFYQGGFWSTDGKEAYKTNRIRTKFIPLQDLLIKVSEDVQYQLYYYDAQYNFLYATEALDQQVRLLSTPIQAENSRSAMYVRVLARKGDNLTLNSDVYLCSSFITFYLPNSEVYQQESVSLTPSVYAEDLPENQGVINALKNFDQMVDIAYTPLKDIPQNQNTLPAGTEQVGIPYSSTRPEALFVPNNVSFHTFMTAIKNPNSYLYTVDLAEEYNNSNGKTYYGAVCSTACAYAFGIQEIYSTHQWPTIPSMVVLEEQSVQSLKLCDTIVGEGHVVMISGIVRNAAGEIVQLTVSEAAGLDVKRKDYSAEALQKRLPISKYTYCRYTRIADVKYTESEYVSVGEENEKTVVYNTAIIPRKGDKANWLMGTDVVVDVLEPENFTEVQIYRDGSFYQTVNFEELETCDTGYVMTLSDLPEGTYSAHLSGALGDSMACNWMVVAAQSTAVLTDGGNVRIDFSAINAEPLYVQWMNGRTNGTIHIDTMTAEQIAAGTVSLTAPDTCIKARVAFKTEYGVIFAALPLEPIYLN